MREAPRPAQTALTPPLPPADQCVLPKLDHGKYTAGYKKGLTIIHGSTVEYMCDEGWIMSADEVTCQLGKLVPSAPACIAPARSISVMNIAPAPVKREGPPGERLRFHKRQNAWKDSGGRKGRKRCTDLKTNFLV